VWAEQERESKRARQRAQMEEGRWASRAWGSKAVRGLGRGRRTRGRGCVHGGEIVGERLGTR
jgi:DNA invertase Pin-like site-specific DNA recombinase